MGTQQNKGKQQQKQLIQDIDKLSVLLSLGEEEGMSK
jgi:hypothetical protein